VKTKFIKEFYQFLTITFQFYQPGNISDEIVMSASRRLAMAAMKMLIETFDSFFIALWLM